MFLEENHEKHCKNTSFSDLKWNQVLASLLQKHNWTTDTLESAEEGAITDELLLNFI